MNMTIQPIARTGDLVIEPFGKPGDAEAFAALNLYWLNEFFYVEEEDKRILSDPENIILKPGGAILMARRNGRAVGTVALFKMDDEAYEISKMGVDASYRNQGIGKRLLLAMLDLAKKKGVRKLLICTSSKLTHAIAMYRSVGFVDSKDPRHHAYDRADVFLELKLSY